MSAGDVLAIVEAFLLVAVVVLFLRRQREQETAWTDERRELLNRIAHPEIVAVKRQQPQHQPSRPRGSAHKVGHVPVPGLDTLPPDDDIEIEKD